jgi:hypothetical protein
VGDTVREPGDDGDDEHGCDLDWIVGDYYRDIPFADWISSVGPEDFVFWLEHFCGASPALRDGMLVIGVDHPLPDSIVHQALLWRSQIIDILENNHDADNEAGDSYDGSTGRWRWVD